MYEGLLKSKFYSKCKSGIKLIRARIDVIRKKRISMQSYLRNGVADLLKTGLDINAYERAEELLVELNKSNCYEFIEQSLLHISNHLNVMNKERECPENCRESVSSLIFAAARFADLPELRELRTLFSERYGNSLDFYVNKQFAEKMKAGLPSNNAKLQLLQDIASEYGLKWNSKDLKVKLYGHPADQKIKSRSDNSRRTVDSSEEKRDCGSTGYCYNDPGEVLATKNARDPLNYRPKETFKIDEKFQIKRCLDSRHPREDRVSQTVRKPNQVPYVQDIQADVFSWNKNMNDGKFVERVLVEEEREHNPRVFMVEECENRPQSNRSVPPLRTESELNKKNIRVREYERPTNDKGKGADQDSSVGTGAKPIPTSVRTRHPKPPPLPESVVRSESAKRDHHKENNDKAGEGRRILKFLDEGFYNHQDDEQMMDKLLLHYSKKKVPHESELDSVRVPAESSNTLHKNRDRLNRTASVPCETTTPSETPKAHTRASSFNPTHNANRLVHPKLPEYDDFVARLATLRGH